MKKILVSQAVYSDPKRQETGDMLDGKIIKFLNAAGYVAIPVSNHQIVYSELNWNFENLIMFLNKVCAEGILLTGGSDLGLNENRDKTEKILLEFACTENLPVLGLCRGMQLMGKLSGGVLKEITNHVKKYHQIKGEISGHVNSFHRFAFKTVPPEYTSLAVTSDGVVEAFHHDVRPWEGWMWHPERENNFAKRDISRLRDLFR